MPHDMELLEAALIGFQHQRDEIEKKIEDLRRLIGGYTGSADGNSTQKSRTLSASARSRIAAAQKKRWAAYKAEHGKKASPPRKRVLSAEGRARIIAATKKRWAAFRKAKAAG